MNLITKNITQKSVELTEEQFKDLTAEMIPASVADIRIVALDLLNITASNDTDIMHGIENCRRFLNTQFVIRGIMLAFKEQTKE